MNFKTTNRLSITECCKILNIDYNSLQSYNFDKFAPKNKEIYERLKFLLKEDRRAFYSCKTATDYEYYLSNWPDGLYRKQAEYAIIHEIERIEEEQFFQHNKKTIEGCLAYLKKYPDGIYQNEIKKTLVELKKKKSQSRCLLYFLIALSLCIICLLSYSPATYIEATDIPIQNNKKHEFKLQIKTDATPTNTVIESTVEWIKIINNNDDTQFIIDIETNEEPERNGTIIVKAYSSILGIGYDCITQEINITQKSGLATYFKVSPHSINMDIDGTSQQAHIETDGTAWTVESEPSWITTSANIIDNTLDISAKTNKGKRKEGEIVLKSNNGDLRYIQVAQDGDPTNFSASTYSVNFGVSEDYTYVDITSNSNKKLSVESDKYWLDVTVENNDGIRINCTSNSNPPRRGVVTVSCGKEEIEIEVTQSGYAQCSRCDGKGKISCTNSNARYNYNSFIGASFHQEWGVQFISFGVPFYGWVNCSKCEGAGRIVCPKCRGNSKWIVPYE